MTVRPTLFALVLLFAVCGCGDSGAEELSSQNTPAPEGQSAHGVGGEKPETSVSPSQPASGPAPTVATEDQ
ncbi:MAG: hypothetical protein KIT11_03415 [Fimbriimonadaceae bacterium]|nr:hypothetical protein [Fimbriimonadaceae bacterium]QYK57054.1 MAG: hypothetical protein KF733_06110 [Fimbriimonadaceae bacterium]